jgi:hypothetical protein
MNAVIKAMASLPLLGAVPLGAAVLASFIRPEPALVSPVATRGAHPTGSR